MGLPCPIDCRDDKKCAPLRPVFVSSTFPLAEIVCLFLGGLATRSQTSESVHGAAGKKVPGPTRANQHIHASVVAPSHARRAIDGAVMADFSAGPFGREISDSSPTAKVVGSSSSPFSASYRSVRFFSRWRNRGKYPHSLVCPAKTLGEFILRLVLICGRHGGIAPGNSVRTVNAVVARGHTAAYDNPRNSSATWDNKTRARLARNARWPASCRIHEAANPPVMIHGDIQSALVARRTALRRVRAPMNGFRKVRRCGSGLAEHKVMQFARPGVSLAAIS